MMQILRKASLGSHFTGSYKKSSFCGLLFRILIEQHMYLSSKMRVTEKVLRKRKIMVNTRDNINILVS